jgi:hypothetical protein
MVPFKVCDNASFVEDVIDSPFLYHLSMNLGFLFYATPREHINMGILPNRDSSSGTWSWGRTI